MEPTGVCNIYRYGAVAAVCLLLSLPVRAQLRPVTSFSTAQEFAAPTAISLPQACSLGGAMSGLVFFDDSTSSLLIASGDGSGRFTGHRRIATIARPTSITVGNINGDGMDDIIAVLREQNRIVLFLSDRTDSSYSPHPFAVNFYPESVVIADVSGDGITDILACGKLSAGVTVMRGKGGGTFREPKLLFPAVAVSSIAVLQMNNDAVPDIVLRNWLTNTDLFYFGLGNLQFSEQTVLSYGTDTVSTLYADLNGDRITDAVVTSQQLTAALVYHGDGLGNFTRRQTVSLRGIADRTVAASVRSAGRPDLIIGAASGRDVSVLMNRGDGTFFDEITVGLPYRTGPWLNSDVDGDGLQELIIADDRTPRYTLLWNASARASADRSARYAVGAQPVNLDVSDVDGDGYDDLVTANLSSGTVSLLFGSAAGLHGHVSLEAFDRPTQAVVYARSDSGATLFTVHADAPAIGLTIVRDPEDGSDSPTGETVQYSIPLSVRPSYVLPDVSQANGAVSMYVFSRAQRSGILFYQQVKGTTFVAKSLTPKVPSRILFATIGDLNGDGMTDLVYIYNDAVTGSDLLGAVLNDAKGEFTGTSRSVPLPVPLTGKAFIYLEDLTLDGVREFIVYDQAGRTMMVFAGRPDGAVGPLLSRITDITIGAVQQMQFADTDRDGITDVVYADDASSSLMMLRGRGNGTFTQRSTLAVVAADAVFRLGDFNGDGIIDTAFTESERSTVGVVYGR